MNNKLNWRSTLYLLLLTAAVILIVVWWPELSGLWRVHLFTFVFVTMLMSIGTIIQAMNYITFLPKVGNIGLLPITNAWAIGTLINYLGPFQPGLAARIAIMAKHGITVSDSAIATLRQTFAIVWIALPVSGLCILLISHGKLAFPALGLCVAFLLVPSLLPMFRRASQRILAWTVLKSISPHFVLAMQLPSPKSSFGILMQFTVSAATFYFGYHQFGVEITIAEAYGLACLIYITSLAAVLPGNFGVLELVCAAFGHANGMPLEHSLALAFLYRGASIASAIVLSGVTGIKKWSSA